MSTALYFVVNDAFYGKALPKTHLAEGVLLGSLKDLATEHPELVLEIEKRGFDWIKKELGE